MSILVDDRDLLDRFRAGDRDALDQVFKHYAPYVTGLLRRGFSFYAGNDAVRFAGYDDIFDLEDALQETFRRAFTETARTNYDGLRPFRAYLTAITKNAVINAYQARQRALERFAPVEADESVPAPDDWSAADDALANGHGGPSGNPERDAQTRELRQLLAQFKSSLDEREARIFTLRFEEGLSHTEITARIALSPSKIKTGEARIRKLLLRFMRRHGYLERHGRRPSTLPSTLIAGEKS